MMMAFVFSGIEVMDSTVCMCVLVIFLFSG